MSERADYDTESPRCAVCGELIVRAAGETPVFFGPELNIGEHDGTAYHLNECEDEVFEETYAEVSARGE